MFEMNKLGCELGPQYSRVSSSGVQRRMHLLGMRSLIAVSGLTIETVIARGYLAIMVTPETGLPPHETISPSRDTTETTNGTGEQPSDNIK